MACLVSSCCCGWQTLEHGLFIFAVFDILINLGMATLNVLVSQSSFAGINGLLILADIGLAFGAKAGVRLLLLIWLIVYLVQLFLCLILPPAIFILAFIIILYADDKEISNNPKSIVSPFLDINPSKKWGGIRIQYYLYYVIAFLLGIFYLYVWIMVKSLLTKMMRVEHEEKNKGDMSLFIRSAGTRRPSNDQAVVVGKNWDATDPIQMTQSSQLIHRQGVKTDEIVYNGTIYPSVDGMSYFPPTRTSSAM